MSIQENGKSEDAKNPLTSAMREFAARLGDHLVKLDGGQRNGSNAQEDLFEEILQERGFTKISSKTGAARPYRKAILSPTNKEYPSTDAEENWFMAQPFGTQSFPDFLVGYNGSVIPIELKSNKGANSVPFWNGHIPTELGVYLVTDGKPEATYFRGSDYIPSEERDILLATRDTVRELERSFDQDDLAMKFRVRVAYDSNQESPFTHPDRTARERRAEELFESFVRSEK